MTGKVDHRGIKWGFIVAAVVIAVAAFALLPVLSSVDLYSHQIEQLDDKRETVMSLAAGASITSALISAIPDDTATPIANQLADFSKLFIVILAVILAEKYLITIMGMASCWLMAGASLLIVIYNLWYDRQWLYNTIVKFIILAVALGTLIPVSIWVTDRIEKTFQGPIDEVISEALESENQLKLESESTREGKGTWQQFTGLFTGINDKLRKTVESLIETSRSALGNFVQAIAVMFVTSCVIPILTLLIYIAVIRFVFGLDFKAADAAGHNRYILIHGARQKRLLYR